uniref:Dynein heavy chain tail domain-containing protein n=1 Tax=Timema bartmani TaxID=61472 RepID=A0A7R9EQY6_9NEOP|nr:unnamed protein product [Timema bartmani]
MEHVSSICKCLERKSLQRLLSPHPLAYSTTTQSFPLSSTFHCTPLRHLPLVLHLGLLTLNLISSILFGIVSSHDRTTVLRLASVSADVRYDKTKYNFTKTHACPLVLSKQCGRRPDVETLDAHSGHQSQSPRRNWPLRNYVNQSGRKRKARDALRESYLKARAGEEEENLSQLINNFCDVVWQEFNDIYAVFHSITYDPLSPEDDSFCKDYEMFVEKVEDLDRKLATIFSMALDDCYNLESFFKCTHVMGLLMDRQIINAQVSPKYKVMVAMLHEELDVAKVTLGNVSSLRQLGDGPTKPPLKLLAGYDLEVSIMETPEAQHVFVKYEEMLDYLAQLEEKVFSEWVSQVADKCRVNLNRTLVMRDDSSILQLNFDDELVSILREVSYLKTLGKEDIPEEALDLYQRNEDIRLWVGNLNLVIEWYNGIRSHCTPVEFDLIMDEIEEIDEKVAKVQETLNWNSDDVWVHVKKIRDLVEHLYDRMAKIQANAVRINSIMNTWGTTPLINRKDGKKEALVSLEDRKERVQKRKDRPRAVVSKPTLATTILYVLSNCNITRSKEERSALPQVQTAKEPV